MDRYVTTWKTLNMSSFSRSFGEKSFANNKSTPKSETKRREHGNHRLSICSDKLMRIISSKPDEPLNTKYVDNCDDLMAEGITQYSDENTAPSDYNHPSNGFAKISCQVICERPSDDSPAVSQQRRSEIMSKPSNFGQEDGSQTPKHHPFLLRLQKDLNSPSAAARVRAMRALRSPTKNIYNHFDVPHEEQDIITEEERRSPVKPKSIQEVMCDVVIYVEVRTGEDNRSAGVKKVISELGAKINDRFLRDTTHVVFKDGLQSTYNKAKKWNIPIVSILWIEACKTYMKLMCPHLFPITNLERYENPELYKKIRRQKSMQPNAEDKTRVNKVKLLTKKTEEIEKTAKLNPALRIPRKPKDKLDEILSEFHEKVLNTPEASEECLPLNSKLLQRIRNSPFTPKRNRAGPKEPESSKEASNAVFLTDNETNSDSDFEETSIYKTPMGDAKKMIFNKGVGMDQTQGVGMNQTQDVGVDQTQNRATKSHRRKTINPIQSKPANEEETDDKTKEAKIPVKRKYTRRSSVSAFVSTTLESNSIDASEIAPKSNSKLSTNRRRTMFSVPKPSETVIMEENCDIEDEDQNENIEVNSKTATDSVNLDAKRSSKGRRTTFTAESLDMSEVKLDESPGRRHKKRTIYTPQAMEQSMLEQHVAKLRDDRQSNDIKKTINRRRTLYNPLCAATEVAETPREVSEIESPPRRNLYNGGLNPKTPARASTLLEEYTSSITFSSTKKPNTRRTLFDISMDIIDQRLQNINNSAKQIRSNGVETKLTTSNESSATTVQNSATKNSITPSVSSKQYPVPVSKLSTTKTIGSNFPIAETTPIFSIVKKRKLFAPADMLLTPDKTTTDPIATQAKTPVAKNTPKSTIQRTLTAKKRPRDADVVKSTQVDKKAKISDEKPKNGISSGKLLNSVTVKKQANRRSTLDFETISKLKPVSSSTVSLTQASQKTVFNPSQGKSPCLVYTNMHKAQIEFIKEAVKTLGGFEIEDKVSSNSTHLITLESRRTLNILRGIIRGLWILDYNWIVESVANKKWLHEEEYEIRNFSRAVRACRAERQAFGRHYKIDLFADVGPIFVSPKCKVPCENIKELVKLCSGKIVENHREAKYIIGGDVFRIYEATICLDPLWILDSISINKIKNYKNYLIVANQN